MRAVVAFCAAALLVLAVAADSHSDKMAKYHKRTGAKWLAHLEKEAGVYKLPSGMLFRVKTKGTGSKSPEANDDCDVHYTGTLRDGTKFDSSVDRGSPATFKPTQVIRGWTEALQLMREGDKWIVYIPYDMAYGEHGSPPNIPGYAPLQFEMELLKVKAGGKSADKASLELKEKIGKSYDEIQTS